MKLFGIEINPKTEPPSTVDQILDHIDRLNKSTGGVAYREIMVPLRMLCLVNPGSVAEIIFSSDVDGQTRERLLHAYSMDHMGSTALEDNPIWARMIERFVLPRYDELPGNMRSIVKWYFRERVNLPG